MNIIHSRLRTCFVTLCENMTFCRVYQVLKARVIRIEVQKISLMIAFSGSNSFCGKDGQKLQQSTCTYLIQSVKQDLSFDHLTFDIKIFVLLQKQFKILNRIGSGRHTDYRQLVRYPTLQIHIFRALYFSVLKLIWAKEPRSFDSQKLLSSNGNKRL